MDRVGVEPTTSANFVKPHPPIERIVAIKEKEVLFKSHPLLFSKLPYRVALSGESLSKNIKKVIFYNSGVAYNSRKTRRAYKNSVKVE